MLPDCESAGLSAPLIHSDAFSLCDEFAAALESRRTQFKFCDGVAILARLGDEKSIREPQEMFGPLQPDVREFLESVVAKWIPSH